MKGKAEKAKGRVKEAAGDLTGSKRLKAEGKIEQAAGAAREKVEKFKKRY